MKSDFGRKPSVVAILFLFYPPKQLSVKLPVSWAQKISSDVELWNWQAPGEKSSDQKKEFLICSLVETEKFLLGYQAKDASEITLNHHQVNRIYAI